MRLYVISEFYFVKSPFRSNVAFSQRHGNIKVDPRPPSSSSLQSLPNSQQLSEISDNDKLEILACDEDAERVECDFKMSVLIPDIISICFTQPATVDLATALCGFMEQLIIEKLDLFHSRSMISLYSNLKLQPHIMLYLMEMHKSLTKGETHPFSKTYAACGT